jgi:hypothetical protein
MKYRVTSASRVALYLGTDVGRMHWTSGTSGLTVRLRAGTDVRVVRHLILNLDGGVARFVELSSTENGQLHNHLVGFSAGLKLWT